jgi:hypothetical protein
MFSIGVHRRLSAARSVPSFFSSLLEKPQARKVTPSQHRGAKLNEP